MIGSRLPPEQKPTTCPSKVRGAIEISIGLTFGALAYIWSLMGVFPHLCLLLALLALVFIAAGVYHYLHTVQVGYMGRYAAMAPTAACRTAGCAMTATAGSATLPGSTWNRRCRITGGGSRRKWDGKSPSEREPKKPVTDETETREDSK